MRHVRPDGSEEVSAGAGDSAGKTGVLDQTERVVAAVGDDQTCSGCVGALHLQGAAETIVNRPGGAVGAYGFVVGLELDAEGLATGGWCADLVAGETAAAVVQLATFGGGEHPLPETDFIDATIGKCPFRNGPISTYQEITRFILSAIVCSSGVTCRAIIQLNMRFPICAIPPGHDEVPSSLCHCANRLCYRLCRTI